MQAPIQTFNEEIFGNDNEVMVCASKDCNIQIIRGGSIYTNDIEPVRVLVKIDKCINIFVKAQKCEEGERCYKAMEIEAAPAGTKVHCRKCEGVIGHCIGDGSSRIILYYDHLEEIWIGNEDECVRELWR